MTQIINYTDNVTVDSLIQDIMNLRPIVNPAVVEKANELTAKLTGSDTVAINSGDETYHVNVHGMVCDCKAGQYGQACSHVLAAVKPYVYAVSPEGYRVQVVAEIIYKELVISFC